jgi:membrane protein DedA with SNARE-associated domain
VNVDHLVSSYGYLAVFLLVGLESLGIPLPGETALISAGIYAGHTHRLSMWLIWLVAAVGAILGDNVGYLIGVKGGYRLARKLGPKVRLDEAHLKVGLYAFDRHGVPVVFFGRFVSVLRTYAAFLAGTMRMRWRHFLLANAAGGIVWSGLYTVASYEAGNTLKHISGTLNIVFIAGAVVAIAVVFVLVRRKTKKLIAVAEAAYPGPLPD